MNKLDKWAAAVVVVGGLVSCGMAVAQSKWQVAAWSVIAAGWAFEAAVTR